MHILAGTYRLRNAIYLPSGVRLLGEGDSTVLIKEPSVQTTIAADSDWFDQEITLADATGFQVGDGICIQADNPHDGGKEVLKRTLVARSGNRFKLDRSLRKNIWTMKTPSVSTLFPLVTAEEKANLAIELLVIDGNRSERAAERQLRGQPLVWDCSRISSGRRRPKQRRRIAGRFATTWWSRPLHPRQRRPGMHPAPAQRPPYRNNRINGTKSFFGWA